MASFVVSQAEGISEREEAVGRACQLKARLFGTMKGLVERISQFSKRGRGGGKDDGLTDGVPVADDQEMGQ